MLLTAIKTRHANRRTSEKWTDTGRPLPPPWIRSAGVRAGGGGDVVMRMGTQQRTAKTGTKHHQHVTPVLKLKNSNPHIVQNVKTRFSLR